MWKKLFWSAAFSAFPLLMFAFSGGPPVRRTGAAVDGGADCSGCHRTFAPANSDSRGFTRITAVNYTPGQKQLIRVQVYHPEAKRWGFELTARLTRDENLKAGTFSPSTTIQVKCDPGGNAPCGTDREFAMPFEPATRTGASGLITYVVEWTPPATASGDVVFYAAGNAADGGGTNANDRIYTSSVKISPAAALMMPMVTMDSAVSVQGFGGGKNIAAGSWIEIFGTSLTNVVREWATFDFSGANAPKSLEGVTVTVGGKDAFIRYVSPGQVNAQVPDGIGLGPVMVIVSNAAGASDGIPMTAVARVPGVLAPASFRVNGRQLAVAVFSDGITFAGQVGEIPGVMSRPAKVGESMTFYLVGAGATTPPIAAGMIASGTPMLPNVLVRFGNTPVTVTYAGLAPGAVGLYQINITVPNVAADDALLSISVDGVPVTQALRTVVSR